MCLNIDNAYAAEMESKEVITYLFGFHNINFIWSISENWPFDAQSGDSWNIGSFEINEVKFDNLTQYAAVQLNFTA